MHFKALVTEIETRYILFKQGINFLNDTLFNAVLFVKNNKIHISIELVKGYFSTKKVSYSFRIKFIYPVVIFDKKIFFGMIKLYKQGNNV